MNLTSIILIFVFLILIMFVLKFITGLAKAFFYAIVIFVILAGLFSYFAYKDTKDLTEGLTSNSTLFLLKENKELITGFTMSRLNLSTMKSVGSGTLDDFNGFYSKKEFKKILGDNYKLFIIDSSVFPKTETFNPNDVLSYIKAQNNQGIALDDIRPGYIPDTKAMAFSMLVIYSIRNEPSFLVDGYKSGNITIYPETFIFKVMKFMASRKK